MDTQCKTHFQQQIKYKMFCHINLGPLGREGQRDLLPVTTLLITDRQIWYLYVSLLIVIGYVLLCNYM